MGFKVWASKYGQVWASKYGQVWASKYGLYYLTAFLFQSICVAPTLPHVYPLNRTLGGQPAEGVPGSFRDLHKDCQCSGMAAGVRSKDRDASSGNKVCCLRQGLDFAGLRTPNTSIRSPLRDFVHKHVDPEKKERKKRKKRKRDYPGSACVG